METFTFIASAYRNSWNNASSWYIIQKQVLLGSASSIHLPLCLQFSHCRWSFCCFWRSFRIFEWQDEQTHMVDEHQIENCSHPFNLLWKSTYETSMWALSFAERLFQVTRIIRMHFRRFSSERCDQGLGCDTQRERQVRGGKRSKNIFGHKIWTHFLQTSNGSTSYTIKLLCTLPLNLLQFGNGAITNGL